MTQTPTVSSLVAVPDHVLGVPTNQASLRSPVVRLVDEPSGHEVPATYHPVRLHVHTRTRARCFAAGCAVK